MNLPDSETCAADIVNSIFDGLFEWFSQANHGTHSSIEEEKTSLSIIKERTMGLLDYLKTSGIPLIREIAFKSKDGRDHALSHVQCYKQHVFNLCGYHMLYNILSSIQILRAQDLNFPKILHSGPLFWKFHTEVSKWLLQYAKEKKLFSNKFPWDYVSLR